MGIKLRIVRAHWLVGIKMQEEGEIESAVSWKGKMNWPLAVGVKVDREGRKGQYFH